MSVAFSQSYIDQACDARDVSSLSQIVGALDLDRGLPAPFTLFTEIVEWTGMSRSGIWQYYEHASADDIQAVADSMEQFGLQDIAMRFRGGLETWNQPEGCDELDDWIDDNYDDLMASAVQLVADRREQLYPQD